MTDLQWVLAGAALLALVAVLLSVLVRPRGRVDGAPSPTGKPGAGSLFRPTPGATVARGPARQSAAPAIVPQAANLAPPPVVAEEPAPVVAEEPAPVVAEEPAPVVAEEPAPVVAEEPTSVVAEEPAPVVAEEPPATAEAPAPVIAEQPPRATAEAPAQARAPDPASPPPIVIEGRTLSPWQYRWLFPDLASLPDSADLIARHFAIHGRHEIGRHRFAIPDRLLTLDLQRLSPVAPNAAPSSFWRYVPGTSKTLNIICSHYAPEGYFGPTIPQTNDDPQIYIKYAHHEWYQRGVPGLTAGIEDTARWLEAVIARLGATRVRVVGFSAAGYGAILFGHLLGADATYAVGAELVLGRPQYRSWHWYPQRQYHPAYKDLRPFMPAMKDRLALLYPAYDPMEFRSIQEARALGIDNVGMFVDFHPGSHGTDRAAMVNAPEALAPMERVNAHPYADPFDDQTVEQLATAYEVSIDRDYARSKALLREVLPQHPRNHGFLCHLGIQEALTGAEDMGLDMIRSARAAMVRDHGQYGLHIARTGKAIVRGFYAPPPPLLRKLEAAFDSGPSQAEPGA